jgi:PP-loop superfamily ATP-utilizing enzyme
MVEAGEAHLRGLGFRVLRVRHHVEEGGKFRARVQVAPSEMGAIAALQPRIEEGLLAAGYDRVEIDPAGYQG